jgi:hypothetical protein
MIALCQTMSAGSPVGPGSVLVGPSNTSPRGEIVTAEATGTPTFERCGAKHSSR